MFDIRKTDIIVLGRNELLEITKGELEKYKLERQYGQVGNNIPRLKNLDALEKRLGYFSIGDSEVSEVRNEVKQLLNEDVYKRPTPKGQIQNFSCAEEYIKARLRSK